MARPLLCILFVNLSLYQKATKPFPVGTSRRDIPARTLAGGTNEQSRIFRSAVPSAALCFDDGDGAARHPYHNAGTSWLLLALLSTFLLIAFSASADSLTNAASATLTNTVSSLPASFPTALPDAGASVFRVLGALILVIAVFFGGVWLFKNWQRVAARKGGGAKLNLLEVKSLGQRQAIYVVGYQQQRMLLASSPAGVTLLSHLPAADETETAAAPAAGKMSFAEAFQQVLSRKQ